MIVRPDVQFRELDVPPTNQLDVLETTTDYGYTTLLCDGCAPLPSTDWGVIATVFVGISLVALCIILCGRLIIQK